MNSIIKKKAVSVQQIQCLDKTAIEKYGIPAIVLMENAGRCVAAEIIDELRHKKSPKVCIICGLGNNAGDGFVAARYLWNAGIETKIFLVGRADKLKEDAAINYQILKKLRYPIEELDQLNSVMTQDISKADIVVDAVFGVGLNREISEPFKSVIQSLNDKAQHILSVDIPSGLDGTTGKIYGVCVQADTTVTLSLSKKGFYKNEGPKRVGKVVVVDIGIPTKLKNRYGGFET